MYKCNKCNREFEKQTSLNAHMSCHSIGEYECNKCGRMFLRKTAMMSHSKTCGFRFVHPDSGYVMITTDEGARELEHVYIAERMIGRKLLPTEIVHHIDENRQNNSEENLLVMSRSQHTRHHAEKLIPSMVRDIRELLAMGNTAVYVADLYGVRSTTIDDIRHNRTWKHIQGYNLPGEVYNNGIWEESAGGRIN